MRAALAAALAAYSQRYPEEQAVVDRFLALLQAREDCAERSCTDPGHLTGSAWILSPDGDRALLTHHRKLDLWVQLGGHADGELDLLAVACREGLEESGLPSLEPLSPEPFDLDIHTIPARGEEPEHEHFDVRFIFQAPQHAVIVSDESHDLAWVPLAEMGSVTQETSIARMVGKTPSFL